MREVYFRAGYYLEATSMKTVNRDFFYYDPEANFDFADFTSDEVFTPEERKDFLANYSDFLRDAYNLPDESVKPVTEEEAMDLAESISAPVAAPRVSKRLDITKMQASLVEKKSAYKNWDLYTARAVVEGDTIVLKGDPLPPNPNAGYRLNPDDNASEFEIAFYMDEAYDNKIPVNGITDVYTHRLVSVRSGIKEIIDVAIYPNGVCRVRYPVREYYHPKGFQLGTAEFGKWQTLKIKLTAETIGAQLGDNEAVELPRKITESPDILFFSTGMFQMGEWKIRPEKIVTEKGEITEFFLPEDTVGAVEEIGEVSIPYSVGNYRSHDKILRLTKEFEIEAGAKAMLTVGAIDPGGRVYLDGELIAERDSFEQFKVDITEQLKASKKHTLVVEVDPRAPEVLFRWHRNIDSYIGWFCEDITVEVTNEVEITDAKVVTLTTDNDKATAAFSCKTSKPCRVKVYMAKAFCGEEEEALLGEYDSNGEMKAVIELSNIELWSAENPALYSVRFEAENDAGLPVDDTVIETGFRTVEQKNGAIYINGKKTVMKGALIMQYLPPHHETATTHVCPRDWQIVWQYMMLKAMGGNMIRLHVLGYGTNDVRFARYADRMGVMLIWITRYIDSIEQMEWEGPWRAKDGYLRQISLRLNHPSIVIWEGSNEYHASLEDIDRIHESYVPAVKAVDTSRLLCPLSFHYYAGPDPETSPFNSYSTDGKSDAYGRPANATEWWTDPLVVRSTHPYIYLMGYGFSWELFHNQPWGEQNKMIADKDRAFLATEFAVIGRQDPRTKEAKELFFQPFSYEFPNEDVLKFPLTQDDWRISQAYQALCISYAVRKLRIMDVDGMLWCCLMGGANDAGYLKPPIDNYGYAKYGFYAMKENYEEITCFNDTDDTKRGKDFAVKPVLFADPDDTVTVTAEVIDLKGNRVDCFVYDSVKADDYIVRLPEWKPEIKTEGYYAVQFTVER